MSKMTGEQNEKYLSYEESFKREFLHKLIFNYLQNCEYPNLALLEVFLNIIVTEEVPKHQIIEFIERKWDFILEKRKKLKMMQRKSNGKEDS